MDCLNFKNKVAVVTGSSRGIGKVIARRLAEHGAVVFLNGRDAGALKKTEDEFLSDGLAVKSFAGNVADEDTVNRLISFVTQEQSRLDFLVNNAGLSAWKFLPDVTSAEWSALFDANIKSMFLTSKAAVAAMRASGIGGRIINIASTTGLHGRAGGVHYAASKSAIIGFSKALALEVGHSNINVNVVAPGLVDTELSRRHYNDGVFNETNKKTPIGRIATPEDVASAVLFFCSSMSAAITGEVLVVDGGKSM